MYTYVSNCKNDKRKFFLKESSNKKKGGKVYLGSVKAAYLMMAGKQGDEKEAISPSNLLPPTRP
jgi:hypothetical protein